MIQNDGYIIRIYILYIIIVLIWTYEIMKSLENRAKSRGATPVLTRPWLGPGFRAWIPDDPPLNIIEYDLS